MTLQWPLIIDITMGNDIDSDAHYEITMGNDIAMCTHHGITMHNDIAMNLIFYYVFSALCLIMISLWVVCHKTRTRLCLISLSWRTHLLCLCRAI